ncbi:hypothetical protein PYW07_015778 [Mythimna separata]|uniref:Uncharacterized protein n=1 Tax=Mythimna separata TaxID=271217 RepID=A0AAD7Y8Z5_MYTSE|nr:hypothetical protein PYW07_010840 [Mythimna separata]KAJ8706919.1 hypothetical protein PYW07_012997 [Mythimna separata]KAJ8713296.1 hypothetical protein PYW07_013666 [Mythimna separata]KAJ8724820.1 hypothetical protein PYW07_015778 [Mythimna separata]
MKETCSKKFKDVLVGSTVLVDVPKVDRGPLDANSITGIVLDTKNNLFQIGTSVGIIRDWLPRNALQLSTVTLTDSVPSTTLSLREIAGKLSLFGGQGFKQCSCQESKVRCKTNKCACKKNNVLCNSRCHKSATCFNK